MAEEFDHLLCPICGTELVYSEGTHDLGCKNNPKPLEEPSKKRERVLHENPGSYGKEEEVKNTEDKCLSTSNGSNKYKSYKLCNYNNSDTVNNVCDIISNAKSSQYSDQSDEGSDFCVFGLSFTESAKNGTLWSIRIVDGETNYEALMRLMRDVERRFRAKEPLAENVPNLPKKIERTNASKLAFRYNLEIEDLFSIKYSTETIERLAMFYNLTSKEVRHIKQTEVLED